jgi:hypothetical protein
MEDPKQLVALVSQPRAQGVLLSRSDRGEP